MMRSTPDLMLEIKVLKEKIAKLKDELALCKEQAVTDRLQSR